MCMLSYFPPKIQPDLDHLANGAMYNRDGHGFAIVAGNRLIIRHSMDEWPLLNTFADLRAKHPHGPALFHSRFGTAGTRDRRNCHPFRIGGDRRTVIGHNGILPQYSQPHKGDQRCDTRVCAEDIMRNADIGDTKYRRALGDWMTARNKFVILTVNPRYKASAYIINESAGIWDENGVWYSNDDYVPYTPPTAEDKARWAAKGWWTGGDTKYDWEKETVGGSSSGSNNGGSSEHCALCGSYGQVDLEGNFCRMCGTCVDCEQDTINGLCQCYTPETGRTDEQDGALAYWARQKQLELAFSDTEDAD